VGDAGVPKASQAHPGSLRRVFTGIVRERGRVVGVEGGENGLRLEIAAPKTAAGAQPGDSVSLDGLCLTVIEVDDGRLSFDAVPESLQRSNFARLAEGDEINVEPALRVGEPLGGHYVQGHVDAVGRVASVEPEGEGLRIWTEAPPDILRYCVEKGSITVDGVALTITELREDAFEVALVPHTLEQTTLGMLAPGDEVNLEVDVLAKYVERLVRRAP
jgi:riboflavin synthase